MTGPARPNSSHLGRRLLRLTWPFLASSILLTAASWASLWLIGAGRAYVAGESLWSKGQKDAVQFLARFSQSCHRGDLAAYRREIALPLGDRAARLALSASPPDEARAAAGFLQGGNHPDDVPAMIALFRYLGAMPPFDAIIAVWTQADELLMRLDALADDLERRAAAGCGTEAEREAALDAIFALNEALTPLQRAFTQKLGDANRQIARVLMVSTAAAGMVLCMMGLALTMRSMRRELQVEHQLQTELEQRREAMHALRHTLLATAGHGGPGESGAPAAGQDDIVQLTQAVGALVAREHALNMRLSGMLTLLPDAVIALDRDGLVTEASGAVRSLIGRTPETLIGQPVSRLLAQLGASPAGAARARSPSSPRPPVGVDDMAELKVRLAAGPVDLQLADGPVEVIQLRLGPGNGSDIAQVLYARDVSRERAVERMKSEFVAAAAHEMRTPLTSIHAAVELLIHRSQPSPRQATLLEVAQRQSTLMMRILSDLLDVERLGERGRSALDVREFELGAAVRSAAAMFIAPAGREPPVVETDGSSWRIVADEDKIRQVIGNLLSNAYKYSSAGPVKVSLAVGPAQTDHAGLIGLRIADQGIGMSDAVLRRLGERFFRADASGAVAGTGLGFNIVRQIVELHGGRIEVASAPGAGTTITCWLPAAPG